MHHKNVTGIGENKKRQPLEDDPTGHPETRWHCRCQRKINK